MTCQRFKKSFQKTCLGLEKGPAKDLQEDLQFKPYKASTQDL